MVSRRPQHPASPSLPPVSGTPRDVSLDQVEAILHDLVAGMAPDPVPARGRPRILPALALWSGLLVGILRGSSAIAGTWRLLSGAGLWWFPRFPISDQAVAKRIADDDGATIRTMFTAISSGLAPIYRTGMGLGADGADGWEASNATGLRLPRLPCRRCGLYHVST